MEELKEKIKSWLEGHGFKYHKGEDSIHSGWYKIWWTQGPVQTIIINGETQSQQASPTQHAVAFGWDDEPGYVENLDGSGRQDFLQGYLMLFLCPGGNDDQLETQAVNINIYNMGDVETALSQFANIRSTEN